MFVILWQKLSFDQHIMNTNGCIRYVPPGVNVEESSLVISLTKLLSKHSMEIIVIMIIKIILILVITIIITIITISTISTTNGFSLSGVPKMVLQVPE